MPKSGELSCSSVDFEVMPTTKDEMKFRITLKELQKMADREPGTCWTNLFPSTIMAAGFSVIHMPEAFGLQIPFGAMLEMADILCDVTLEDDDGNFTGVYFDSASFVLYATHYFEKDNIVQWHLRKKSKEKRRDQALRPNHGSKLVWARELSIEILSEATAVLGYCSQVEVQLGTG